jgi:thiosulfate/3-mercaptopyruvate sulfurtransferase
MRRFVLALLFAFACARFAGGPGAAAAERPEPSLVTPAWLADHLQDPKLVVLHVSSLRDDYTREHIPGARFLWPTWLVVSTPDLAFEMPTVDSLAAVLRRLGISNDSEVVLYHVLGDVAGAARVFVTFDYLGMGGRTKILDGGLAAWKAAGRSVTAEEPEFPAGSLVPKVRQDVVYHLDTMRSRYDAPGIQLLDARSPQDYNAVEGLSVFRGGHIPRAINVPMAAVLDSLDRYQPPDSIAARFQRAGVKPGSEIITYCGLGRTACPLYVAARMLGFTVRLYDGSFQEWSRRVDLPVENTKKKRPE